MRQLLVALATMVAISATPLTIHSPSSVAEVCISGNHEEKDVALLRQGAESFNIPALAELAELLAERRLDRGNALSRKAIFSLTEYAEQHFGKDSREAVLCRKAYIQAIADTEKDLALRLSVENVGYAKRLSQQSPKDNDAKVLALVTQMERIFMESQQVIEDPNHWSEVLEIEKAMEPIAKGKSGRCSPEWVDLCLYMSVWKAARPAPDLINYFDYLFNERGARRLYAYTEDTNLPSQQLHHGLLQHLSANAHFVGSHLSRPLFHKKLF